MKQRLRSSPFEPAWHSLSAVRATGAPAAKTGWLLDPGSLTQKLVNACDQGVFQVRLVAQHWARPLYTESRILHMRRGEMAFIREVQLLCNQTPWVFARTLIPASSFSGKARRLAHLGNKPLGALLFADPQTIREKMQLAKLTTGHLLYQHACIDVDELPSALWGRRTLFYYAHQPLLVNEIFLPDIPNN